MPSMPLALAHKRVGGGRMEIRALPALLSSGTSHLERAILSPATVDHDVASSGRNALSLRGLPVQFRELPPVQGKVFLAQGTGIG